MNILQLQNNARAAWETARTICKAPAWDTLDAASRADWYARFERELNKGAIAAQDDPAPVLTSPALDDVCTAAIDYNGKGVPHIMGITAPLVAIHRGKSYDDSERLTIAKDVARAARELATALETAT